MASLKKLTGDDLFIDPDQGVGRGGQAIGFIGWRAKARGEDDYCGWFFSWPKDYPSDLTPDQIDAVVESMDADETSTQWPKIPHAVAAAKLRKLLESEHAVANAGGEA